MALADRDHVDRALQDAVDDPIVPEQDLANSVVIELGNLSPAEWHRRGLARSRADPRDPARGGLRIVERDVLEDVLEVSNGSRRPPAFHFRAALRCSKRWA